MALPHLASARLQPLLQPCVQALSSCRQAVSSCRTAALSVSRRQLTTASCPASTSQQEDIPVKKWSEIPGPRSYPFIKAMPYVMKNLDNKKPEKLYNQLFRDFDGPIVKFELPYGQPDVVAFRDPQLLKELYKNTDNNPLRNSFHSLKKVRDENSSNYFNKKSGLLPEDGEEWWRLRSRVQSPLMRPRNVAKYLPQVDRATVLFLEQMHELRDTNGKLPENFLNELYRWALECIGYVSLDRKLGCLERDLAPDSDQLKIIELVNKLFAAMNKTEMSVHIWKFWRTKALVELETVHNELLSIVDVYIEDSMRKLEEKQARGAEVEYSVLDTYLKTEGLSKSDVATMIMDMIFAGIDTTSHTVAFTMYQLARNPDKQKVLQEEIDAVIGLSNDITAEHLAKLKYLPHAVKEALRLHPITIGIGRRLNEDTVIAGYNVKRGTLVASINTAINRNEEHFEKPEEFLPERWQKDRPHGKIHPYANLPFSHGKRMRVGKRVAQQEIYCLLARIFQKYTVLFEGEADMQLEYHLIAKPTSPLAFTLQERL